MYVIYVSDIYEIDDLLRALTNWPTFRAPCNPLPKTIYLEFK